MLATEADLMTETFVEKSLPIFHLGSLAPCLFSANISRMTALSMSMDGNGGQVWCVSTAAAISNLMVHWNFCAVEGREVGRRKDDGRQLAPDFHVEERVNRFHRGRYILSLISRVFDGRTTIAASRTKRKRTMRKQHFLRTMAAAAAPSA